LAKKPYRTLRLIALGPHFVATTLVGWAIGKYLLDPWLETDPVFTITLILLGFVASFIHLLRELKALDESNEPDQPEE